MNIVQRIKRIVNGILPAARRRIARGGGEEQPSESLKVTVLVFTYNRCHLLKRALESVMSQSVAADEVIVVDGGSNDGTKEMVNAFSGVTYVEIRERDDTGEFVGSLAHSVNEGFKIANNEFVFLLGDDVILLPDCLKVLRRDIHSNLDNSAWVCLYGATKKALKYDVYNDLLMFNMGVIRRSHLFKLGGFDEQYRFYGWDKEFSLRCWHKGCRLFPSRAGILHYAAQNEMRAQIGPDLDRTKEKYALKSASHMPYNKFMKQYRRYESRQIIKGRKAEDKFLTYEYVRHNYRRLEHLESLGLHLHHMNVLEVGAGIGELTSYFLDRGCDVLSTDARPENVRTMQERYSEKYASRFMATQLDLDSESSMVDGNYDLVMCYGILYHLRRPAEALLLMAEHCKGMMIVETCVSFGDKIALNLVEEIASCPTQAYSGVGCRPTRSWVFSELKKHFEYVYVSLTQPCDEQFPLDWMNQEAHKGLSRAVFVASRTEIDNPLLQQKLIMHQTRHQG